MPGPVSRSDQNTSPQAISWLAFIYFREDSFGKEVSVLVFLFLPSSSQQVVEQFGKFIGMFLSVSTI